MSIQELATSEKSKMEKKRRKVPSKVSQVVLLESDSETEVVENTAKKTRNGLFEFDSELTKKLASRSTPALEKIATILQLHHSKPEQKTELSEKARQLAYKCIDPVYGCLTHHYQSNKESFVATHGNSFSRFFMKCKGDEAKTCIQ
jgi:hypothetical protein